MSVESATYLSQLDPTLPASGDPKSEGDNHLRLLKAALKATFPNLSAAAITAATADLNTLAGAATNGATGLNVATQAALSNSTLAASTAMVQSAILASIGITAALPGQTGNAGKFLSTDGVSALWAATGLTRVLVTTTTQAAVSGSDYWASNAAATTLTAPASADGAKFAFTPVNGLMTNTIDFGASAALGPFGSVTGVLTLDLGARMEFEYSSTLGKWVSK